MLFEEALRLKHSAALLRGDEDDSNACFDELLLGRLKLSHALYAVGSPSAAEKLEDGRPLRDEFRERVLARAVCRAQAKIGSAIARLKCAAVVHEIECSAGRLTLQFIIAGLEC